MWLLVLSWTLPHPPSHADALTSIRSVNNTDVITLGTKFGSLAAIMAATQEQLATCPGIGPAKVKRMQETFRAPFRRAAKPLRQPRIDEQLGGGAGAEAPPVPPPDGSETELVLEEGEGGDGEHVTRAPADEETFQLADDELDDEYASVLD
jgi:NAD-dependent DNA ligase